MTQPTGGPATQAPTSSTAPTIGWLRRYPPMISLLGAMFIGVAILPSSLNVDQENPSQVAEYAPVPPDDESPTSDGSMSSLGLGSGGGLSTGLIQDEVEKQVAKPLGNVKKPRNKDCVEFPDGLKQTNDPNAPPCAPFFDGNNGGATFQGVTADEITVLFYQSMFIAGDQNEQAPGPGYCDLNIDINADGQFCTDTATGIEMSYVRVTRSLARYFNERFQTYGRAVHFYVYWTPGAQTPGSRRAEAADNWERLKPFAVVDNAFFGGFNAVYAEAMVRRKVSVYGSFASLANEHFQKNAPFVWSFWPDIEHWADQYTSYICQKVAPQKTVLYSGPALKDKDRVYALLYTTDESYPGLHYFRELFKQGIKSCPNGAKIDWVVEKTFPIAGFGAINADRNSHIYASEVVADLQKNKVTTILWLGGMEGKISPAANDAKYYPEWFVAGDMTIDNGANGRDQNQEVWKYAVTVTNLLREGKPEDVPSRQALRESDPAARQEDEDLANTIYRPFFMLWKSIQVAGPQLSPQNIDRGQHAIPRVKSTSPYVAACYYDVGDYTCVKDAAIEWWDPTAPDPNGDSTSSGCWRMVSDGTRFPAREWDQVGEPFVNGANDPCNGFLGEYYGNANP
ncbi:MAG: hypothetical protein ABIS18_11085 [Actinomycetota bacterium]